MSWMTSPCTSLHYLTTHDFPMSLLRKGGSLGLDTNFLGLRGGAEGISWEGCPLSGSWLEWSCEEGHLADACKSTSRLESSKLLSYYLSSRSILISSGPCLASLQLQEQD